MFLQCIVNVHTYMNKRTYEKINSQFKNNLSRAFICIYMFIIILFCAYVSFQRIEINNSTYFPFFLLLVYVFFHSQQNKNITDSRR